MNKQLNKHKQVSGISQYGGIFEASVSIMASLFLKDIFPCLTLCLSLLAINSDIGRSSE